ncbi:MAG: hypothetical protein JSS07_06175 [Proteobacteria bacterium]|nr:hypothetical protein [Pseudomonadota bacterium]
MKNPQIDLRYLIILVVMNLLLGCTTGAQTENYGWHSNSTVRIQTGAQMDKFYDDPLYYYYNEFDWLYLN